MLGDFLTLESIITDSVAKKHLPKAGYAHAVAVTEYAFQLAKECGVCIDAATKAALLHDIGHTNWERHGEWDYDSYNDFDIHTIKGAERAHELLILKGEDLGKAREIALAILFHSGSSPITNNVKLTPLQQVVAEADDMDEQEGGAHHRVEIDFAEALQRIRRLDMLVHPHRRCCNGNCENCETVK